MESDMHSGFSFDKVVIIQSLGGADILTGDILSKYIPHICEEKGFTIPVELINCESGSQFLQIIHELVTEASNGTIPLLHVECHGDPNSGLDFKDGSDLSWQQISDALLSLNVATRFNLMAIFSACFGFYFVERMGAIDRAPCWCLVAPTSVVYEDEIMGAFRDFYRDLFLTNSVSMAFRSLSKWKLRHGRWICTVAEDWFEKLIVGYIERHCTIHSSDKRIKRYYRYAKSKGLRWSRGYIKRLFSKRNRYHILNKYFNKYFLIQDIPENSSRFSSVHVRINKRLADLRSTRKYYI